MEFDKKLSSCCNRMTRAWEDREKMMNGIVARIVHFQVCPSVDLIKHGTHPPLPPRVHFFLSLVLFLTIRLSLTA